MSNVSLAIYGFAALWAVQMLLALMVQHRRRTLVRLQRAEIARREAEARRVAAEAANMPGKKSKSPARSAIVAS